MSVLGLERAHTASGTPFDHPITLLDATNPSDGANDTRDSSDSEDALQNDGGPSLTRQWTRSSLRKQLAQRKYAKYRRDGEDGPDKPAVQETLSEEPEDPEAQKPPSKKGTWGTESRLRDKVALRSKKKKHHGHRPEDETFIDVLYENQRGMFLCGMPLYSAKGLLNFDPAEWQNAHFKDSSMDIRDAQLPDPSWQWVWRTWYVDMSHDVDEQGWEYSFNFGRAFNWHGSHPWFHSFVRRRRWLRKRAKVHGHLDEKREGRKLQDAHKLNNDYFTIHAAARDRSRDASGDRTNTFRSSTMGSYGEGSEDEDVPEEIEDIPTLLSALKKARVDREKIIAVNNFLQHGGEELAYLAEHIQEIMEDLIHQTSRRQLQHHLLKALDEAQQQSQSLDKDSDEAQTKQRQINNILKAIEASGVHDNDEHYWSTLKSRTDADNDTIEKETHALDPQAQAKIDDKEETRKHIETEAVSPDDIKGISEEAEISKAPQIRRGTMENEDAEADEGDDGDEKQQQQQEEEEKEEQERQSSREVKGKGKEIA